MEPRTDPDFYGEGVRSTDWRSPEDECKGFHLPPGFEIRLFASEPQISKPLNMAFDQQGRLWVTNTVEYPYPATDSESARDTVSILQDTDGDGEADQVTMFAEGLNIPMGVLPYRDGCLCFSIPNILFLKDTDGDGRCDQREVVLGPFDTTRDTHGMINSLRDVGDGWIYACHGFNNQSQVAGSDGHAITMHSGNTFRFRPDGSRVENFTFGQVNPFGMTVDQWGYLYSADCHSKPITQLIRGAYYPSFGKPHDGLGFLPPMLKHLHGSTAISGLQFFPPDSSMVPLRDQFISGNVMTSRLNRNRRIFHGATAIGEELPDFLTSDDPWFRPVDIQLGPDCQIYVADFYNKIIGHYEVPLNHQERDRKSGRIWQIRYTENRDSKPVSDLPILPLGQPDDSVAYDDALRHASPLVRLNAMRSLNRIMEQETPNLLHCDLLRKGLSDVNEHVVRISAESLGQYGQPQDVNRLLNRLSVTPENDPVLRQTIRIAIRNLLSRAPADADLWSELPKADLASIFLGVHRPEVSAAILKYLLVHSDAINCNQLLSHAARNADSDRLNDCVEIARKIAGGDREKKFGLLAVLCDAQNARPGNVARPTRQWAQQLVQAELANVDTSVKSLVWTTDDNVAWPREKRKLHGGGEAMFVSSLGRGETYIGQRTSEDFVAPHKIVFWLAGHNGFPQTVDRRKNLIRLVLAKTGEVLHQVTPPRTDIAQQIQWDTTAVEGQSVRIECIDGDSGTAYAWLGVGKFEPVWMDDANEGSALKMALSWIERLGLDENSDALESLLEASDVSLGWRIEIARVIASLRADPVGMVTLKFLQSSNAPADLVEKTVEAMLNSPHEELLNTIKQLCQRLSLSEQRDFAVAWATSGAPTKALVDMVQSGWISREVLLDPAAVQAMNLKLSEEEQLRVKELTKGLNADTQISELMKHLNAMVASRRGSRENGRILYTKHCAVCHQLREEGAVVGPQLDGAITRSTERLLEDIVTPNRNIDQAFRTTSFLLDDGRVIAGMVTSESADEISVVQSNGEKVRIDSQNIELRRETGQSLMPSNFAEILSAESFSDLICFLRGKD